MGLQTYLLPIFILCFCSYSCYSSSQNVPPLSSCIDEATGYNRCAYPTYFGTIDDDEDAEIGSEFTSMMTYKPEFFSVERYVASPESSPTVVSVEDFGAKGNGKDDTEAFMKAWKKTCSSAPAVLLVPKNKNYLVKPITFSGPCRSDITVMIYGTIQAPSDRSAWSKSNQRLWIMFNQIQNLRVQGGGTINGNGAIWWKNSCKINKALPCKDGPTALTFNSCKNLRVSNIKIKDGQQMQVSFQNCVNVQASNLMVTAPGNSPNTDGIHITATQNIQIMSTVIGTGDDCISIESGSSNVKATDITCGPGHGISIGSLGDGNSEAHVSGVTVDRATIRGTTNGVRIKTYQGGSGDVKNVIFQNIAMQNVDNPIIIDQNYCDSKTPCKQQSQALKISNVVYKNIKGTSATKVAVNLDCSKKFSCQGIVLQDINLVGNGGKPTTSFCNNVSGSKSGTLVPKPCF